MRNKHSLLVGMFFLFVLIGVGFTDTNANSSYWLTTLTQSGQDFGANVVTTTSDGGAVFAGGRGDSKVAWVIKKDSSGQTLWKYSYSGIYYVNFHSVEELSDGTILVAGANSHNGVVGGEAWVMKLSQAGQVIYQSLLRSGNYGYVNDISPTSDGGAVLTGYTYSSVRSDDLWLVKINSSGGIVWQKYYHGSNGSDGGQEIVAATDGYYVVGWVTTAPTITKYMVLKFDLSGNLLWAKAITNDAWIDIAVASDGLIVTGGDAWGQMLIVRLNLDGSGVWGRKYDFGPYDSGNSPVIVGGNIVIATGYSGNIVRLAYSNGDFVSGTHFDDSYIEHIEPDSTGDIYVSGIKGNGALVAKVNSLGNIPNCSVCTPVTPVSVEAYNSPLAIPSLVAYTPSAAAFSYTFNPMTWPLTENAVCTGSTGTFTLSGQLRDAAGFIIVGKTVKLEQNGNTVATATTNNQGNYTFPNVTTGQYYINLSDSGFFFNPSGANVTVTGNVVRNFQASWPAPFLDLPIHYDGTGESAFQAAFVRFTTSVLDHHYPLGEFPDAVFNSYTGGTFGRLGYDNHSGYDFSGKLTDQVIVAPAYGKVIFNAHACLGNTVKIDHLNGFVTIYGHLHHIPTLPQYLNAGEQIGMMGNTVQTGCSTSTGVHLHFGVEYNGRTIDPSGWISTDTDPWTTQTNGIASQHMWKYALPPIQSWEVTGSSGATLIASAGTYEFVIPAGSFSGTKTFDFTEAPAGDDEIGTLQPTGYSFEFVESVPGVTREPELLFNYTVEFNYGEYITDFNENTLEVFYWENATNAWVDLNASVNVSQNTATVVTNRQGVFALYGEASNTSVFLPFMTLGENLIPNTPTNLTVNAIGSTAIHVFWQDNSQIEDMYEIWWLPGGGNWQVRTLDPNTTSGYVSNLNCSTHHYIVVRAVNNVNGNLYYTESNFVEAYTLAC